MVKGMWHGIVAVYAVVCAGYAGVYFLAAFGVSIGGFDPAVTPLRIGAATLACAAWAVNYLRMEIPHA